MIGRIHCSGSQIEADKKKFSVRKKKKKIYLLDRSKRVSVVLLKNHLHRATIRSLIINVHMMYLLWLSLIEEIKEENFGSVSFVMRQAREMAMEKNSGLLHCTDNGHLRLFQAHK